MECLTERDRAPMHLERRKILDSMVADECVCIGRRQLAVSDSPKDVEPSPFPELRERRIDRLKQAPIARPA
jgi:hypothetical protein